MTAVPPHSAATTSSAALTTPTTAKPDAAASHFAALVAQLDYLSPEEVTVVREAYHFADLAHLGQMRKSGDPYITHPIAVTAVCAHWKLDPPALMAALLHDAMEDCGVTKEDLTKRFGAQVADLVDGLTKLEKLEFDTREENQAESFRKMLLAMARDVRVILIKLADRTHNMRTLSDMPRNKWQRIASETLEIYAPIAHRLGLNQTYRELQDLSFRHLHPWRYETLSKAVSKARSRRRDLVGKVQADVDAAFSRVHMPVRLAGREKTLYAIYRKMTDQHLSFAQVTDLYGFRVIVPTITDCYTSLGLLHQLYKPVPGKFTDHIAIAKANGYQSLHTTLVGPSGLNIEFQMRTEEMHIIAEAGVAAHWLYKADNQNKNSDHLGTTWMQSLLDIQNETRDAAEFWDNVKVDLFPDAVYVFTPKSQIMALPKGATVVDFAYAIHSNVGDHTASARVNNEPVPLRTELTNGDVVEIITDDNARPNPAWLGFVHTGRARSKIRNYLKTLAQNESESLGTQLLQQALRAEGLDDFPEAAGPYQHAWEKTLRFTGNRSQAELLAEIGLGKRVASLIARKLLSFMGHDSLKPNVLQLTQARYGSHETVSQGSVMLDGTESASIQYARCCRPVPGDSITGYLGQGDGLVVHVTQCSTAVRLQKKDSERFISVDWSDDIRQHFEAGIIVTIRNGKGILARVAAELANTEVDIVHVEMDDEVAMDTIDLRFTVSVRDRSHLETALGNLSRIPSVVRARRILSLA